MHSADDLTLKLTTFDALSYVQIIPQDIQNFIKKIWYEHEPVFLRVSPYSLYKHTSDYPVSFNADGVMSVGSDAKNESLMARQLVCNKSSYVAGGSRIFNTPSYTLDLNHALKCNPVWVCGPSNAKNGFCFINKQLWALSTRERFICSNFLIRTEYTEVAVEKINRKNRFSSFTPRAIAPDGSRCVLELDKNSRLWLCDLKMVNGDINITYDPLTSIALYSSNKSIRVIKLCELGVIQGNQKICMPRQDSVVICNVENQIVWSVNYKNSDSDICVVDIPDKYIVTDLYGIDKSSHFVLDMFHDNKENNLKKRVLGVWSLENRTKPIIIFLDDELQQLSVAPNLNTPKLFNKVEEYKRALYIRPQRSLFWDAALFVRIAQQLAEKTAWNKPEEQIARHIIGAMQKWAKNKKIDPYYFCWLAQNPAGDTNYFREIYMRLYSDRINAHKLVKSEDPHCAIA